MGWKNFAEGGLASIVAGSVTHPLDLIKVRMQLQGESVVPALAGVTHSSSPTYCTGTLSMGRQVVKTEGLKALYSGVSASILRQVLYSSTRLGLYEVLKVQMQDKNERTLPLPKKIVAGLVAGGVGAAVGCPADVAMVRMQADGRLPAFQRRNYTGVGDALIRMVRNEGIASLWTGSAPTVQRAMIVTASQLATYDQIKDYLISKHLVQDGLATHITASISAGFVTSVASNPIDVIKTRIMNMEVKPGQKPPYSGALDCAIKTMKKEGPMALYKGFIPTVTRQGPFAVVLFVTLEQLKSLLKDLMTATINLASYHPNSKMRRKCLTKEFRLWTILIYGCNFSDHSVYNRGILWLCVSSDSCTSSNKETWTTIIYTGYATHWSILSDSKGCQVLQTT